MSSAVWLLVSQALAWRTATRCETPRAEQCRMASRPLRCSPVAPGGHRAAERGEGQPGRHKRKVDMSSTYHVRLVMIIEAATQILWSQYDTLLEFD